VVPLRRAKPAKANQDSGYHANEKQSHAIPLLGDGDTFLLGCHFALVPYLLRKNVKCSLNPKSFATARAGMVEAGVSAPLAEGELNQTSFLRSDAVLPIVQLSADFVARVG
jgi:hypothetical protein